MLKHARVGAQGHGRIDQATTAQAIAHQRTGTGAHAKVEQRVFVANGRRALPTFQIAAHLGAHKATKLAKISGELSGQVLCAALQHGHALAMLGKAQGGHRAAVTRTHHQHLGRVAFLCVGDQLLHTV